MNLRLALIAALALPFALAAQSVEQSDTTRVPAVIFQIQAGGNITLFYPTALCDRLMPPSADEQGDAAQQSTTQAATRVGYRVQVFDDNNPSSAKHKAQARARQMQSRFPEWHTYVQFNSPYWRVKVGDFRSRSEAESAMATIRAAFPAYAKQMRVIRDRINP